MKYADKPNYPLETLRTTLREKSQEEFILLSAQLTCNYFDFISWLSKMNKTTFPDLLCLKLSFVLKLHYFLAI